MLTQSMTNQKNRVHAPVNENGRSVVARVCDFVRINLPEFLGLQTNEDPQNFLDEIKKIFEVMQVTGNDRVKLSLYQLNDVAHICVNRGRDATYIAWDCFSDTFLDSFFPIELRESKAQEIMNLRQGNMRVQEYGLKFNKLSRYDPHMVADSRLR